MKIKSICSIIAILTITACSKDDGDSPKDLITQEIVAKENSRFLEEIGIVDTNLKGNPVFELISQNPAGALTVDTSSGRLLVSDSTQFDFEANKQLEARISISDQQQTETVQLFVYLDNVDDISSILNTSKDKYLAASEGDWLKIQENEYQQLALRMSSVHRAGLSDAFYNVQNTDVLEGNRTWTNLQQPTVPEDSYLFAFKYETNSDDVLDSKIKLSEDDALSGYLDVGNILPEHNAPRAFFVLKGNNQKTSREAYLALYGERTVKAAVVGSNQAFAVEQGDVNNFNLAGMQQQDAVLLYQGLSTSIKQWD